MQSPQRSVHHLHRSTKAQTPPQEKYFSCCASQSCTATFTRSFYRKWRNGERFAGAKEVKILGCQIWWIWCKAYDIKFWTCLTLWWAAWRQALSCCYTFRKTTNSGIFFRIAGFRWFRSISVCNTVLYCNTIYCTTWNRNLLYLTTPKYTTLYYTTLHYTLHYIILCYALLCYAILCFAMLCYAILYYNMLNYIILLYTILYYTIL